MLQTSSSSHCDDPEERYAKVWGLQPPEHLNTIWQHPLHQFLHYFVTPPFCSSDSEDLGASGEQPLEGDDPTYCPPEDSSVRPERETLSLVRERKFIVFESCLDLLLGKCQVCATPLIHVDKSVVGCSLQVYSICRSGHVNDWCSQPIIKRKPVGSILMAAAILFSGSCIKKTPRTLTSMGIVCFSYGTFFNIQKAFLLPSIEKVWNKHQNELFAAAAGRHLTIAADGRADSPGHSAKYGTYTMLDADDNKVIHVETVQVCIKKKLAAAAKSRHLEELGFWTRAVVNHLYWSAGTSVDNQDLILPKWKSLVAHVVGVHTHADPLFPECEHEELKKKWLAEGSPAHQKLVEIVLSPHLLRDIPRLSTSAQTFATECFHSTLLQFAPKQVHFSSRRMKARTYLAALHYNENAGRPQAVTKKGEKMWVIKMTLGSIQLMQAR
ncbi:hypothetical protein HPB47_023472 [Ixodes persulcatus]|uniref:Uncharacterized protein n=1 Tax=Ixodes persulcatus TaxID=34615 RepID=A0AC60Q6V9_IXOPE|nr:hypothetical protein HPB47_023472 [Ixodes persulcatus]